MSRMDTARSEIGAVLDGDEMVRGIETALLKGGAAKRMAKDVAVSAAASVALGAVGLSATRSSAPPQVWVIVTDRRIMLFRDTRERRQPVGDMVIDVPRNEVALTTRSAVWTEFGVVDAMSGDPVFRLNFGVRRKAAAAILCAAAPFPH